MFIRAPEALVEASLRAGCQLFCSYPITPVEEMTQYWVKRCHEFEGALEFVPESEMESGAYLFGFAACGKRCAFASTGTGVSIIGESLGHLIMAESPCVIFDFPRAGLSVSQGDYFLATKAPSHGDGRMIVLAPMGTQEAVDLTFKAFYLADKYRNPVMLMCDYTLGQTMEVVEFPEPDESDLEPKDWALDGDRSRAPRRGIRPAPSGGVTAANVASGVDETFGSVSPFERSILRKFDKYRSIPPIYEEIEMDDAEVAVVAYGTMARMILPVLQQCREQDLKVGMIRPISLFPFPEAAIREAATRVRRIGVMECNAGQMVEDVRLAVEGRAPVDLYARPGGSAPTPIEIEHELHRLLGKVEVLA
jgi:2-oxoglutarate ferredoxin oxidoreductase subunit alpha